MVSIIVVIVSSGIVNSVENLVSITGAKVIMNSELCECTRLAGFSENPIKPRDIEGLAKPGWIKNKFEAGYE
ncbi:MAG: hypothetical protein N3A65_04490 [candidate division WOR-3 bacterium]|nr:hypothetical protein [candidate division WOR-3 bacterium]